MLRDDGRDEANNPVSIRLRGDVRASLREVAARRGVSLSDLLRDAAGAILCAERMCACPSCPSRRAGNVGTLRVTTDPPEAVS